MSSRSISGTTALVTGASRGFGRAIAVALSKAGADVVGVATGKEALEELRAELGGNFTPVVADAADPYTAASLIDAHAPTTLVLNAGAAPFMRPLHHQTWDSFSRNWNIDAQHAFNWTREALLRPLEPGSTVISMSSGASIQGSPASGGYAAAKAAVRFISSYAGSESEREELGIRFIALLPKLTPATKRGAANVAAYARRAGVDVDTFLKGFGPVLTTEQVGTSVLDLATDTGYDKAAYMLTADGLSPMG